MRKQIVSVLLSVAASACCSAFTPKWLVNAEQAFPSARYIRAVGEGKSGESAKKNALSELGAYFSQTVSSELNAVQHLSQSEGFSQTEQLTRTVSTASVSKLFAVHYTNFYYDKSQKSYSVCAYIARDEAWEVLSQKLSVAQSTFESGIALAGAEAEPFKKIVAMNRALSLEAEFFELYDMALAVYPERCGGYTRTAEQFGLEKQNSALLKKNAQISVSANGDFSQCIKAKIESLLSRNGFTISQDGAYTLIATVQAAQRQSGGIYSCEPQIEVLIRGKNGTVASFAGGAEKFSAYNAQTVEKVAVSNLEKLLDEAFVQECLQ